MDDLREFSKPRKMRRHHIDLLTSDDESPFYRDGDVMLLPDGTVVLGPKSYPPDCAIRDDWDDVLISRPWDSDTVQIEFRPGETKYYTYRRGLLWSWKWRQTFQDNGPRSLLSRLTELLS